MQVLLTGGDGFIGTVLHKTYSEVDWIVYDLKRNMDILDVPQLRYYVGQCDAIVHLAAKISQVESVQNPALYYLHNIQGTCNVVQAAREKSKRVLFASSAAVYDYAANPYAMSKWVGERLVETLDDYCVLRFFNVYGPGDRPDTVIPTFINHAKHGKPITIYGDGKQTRDFVHVRDVCFQIRTHLQTSIHRTKDVGTGWATTINNVAALVMGAVGQTIPIQREPARQEIQHSIADHVIAGAISLQDGIQELVDLI